jgi:8-oxo-dGTP diphosphatase
MGDIYKASGILIRDRKLLFTRAKGKSIFIDPGGKIESGETPEQALIRELKEELSIEVKNEDLEYFGEFSDISANDASKTVHMTVFLVKKWRGEVKPSAEIEELKWLDSYISEDTKVGSIFGGKVLPILKNQNLVD